MQIRDLVGVKKWYGWIIQQGQAVEFSGAPTAYKMIPDGCAIVRYVTDSKHGTTATVIALTADLEFFSVERYVPVAVDPTIARCVQGYEYESSIVAGDLTPPPEGINPNDTIPFVRTSTTRARFSNSALLKVVGVETSTYNAAGGLHTAGSGGGNSSTTVANGKARVREITEFGISGYVPNRRQYAYIEPARNVGCAWQMVTWFNGGAGVVISALGGSCVVANQCGVLSRFKAKTYDYNRIQSSDIGRDLGPQIIQNGELRHSYPNFGDSRVWARSAAMQNNIIICTNTKNEFVVYKNVDYLAYFGTITVADTHWKKLNPPYPAWVGYPLPNSDNVAYWRWNFSVDARRAVCIPFSRKAGGKSGKGGLVVRGLKDMISAPWGWRREDMSFIDYPKYEWVKGREDYPGLVEILIGIEDREYNHNPDPGGNGLLGNMYMVRVRDEHSEREGGLYYINAEYTSLTIDNRSDQEKASDAKKQAAAKKEDLVYVLPLRATYIPLDTLITAHIEVYMRGSDQPVVYTRTFPGQSIGSGEVLSVPPYEGWLIVRALEGGTHVVLFKYLLFRSATTFDGADWCGWPRSCLPSSPRAVPATVDWIATTTYIMLMDLKTLTFEFNMQLYDRRGLLENATQSRYTSIVAVYVKNKLVTGRIVEDTIPPGTPTQATKYDSYTAVMAAAGVQSPLFVTLLTPLGTKWTGAPMVHQYVMQFCRVDDFHVGVASHPAGHYSLSVYGNFGFDYVYTYGRAVSVKYVDMFNKAWGTDVSVNDYGYGLDRLPISGGDPPQMWDRTSQAHQSNTAKGEIAGFGVWLPQLSDSDYEDIRDGY